MYLNDDLISDHNYSISNNKSFKNIEIKVNHADYVLTLSAVIKDNIMYSPHFGTFSNLRVNTNDTSIIKILIKNLFMDLQKKYNEVYITFPQTYKNKNINFIIKELLSYEDLIKSWE